MKYSRNVLGILVKTSAPSLFMTHFSRSRLPTSRNLITFKPRLSAASRIEESTSLRNSILASKSTASNLTLGLTSTLALDISSSLNLILSLRSRDAALAMEKADLTASLIEALVRNGVDENPKAPSMRTLTLIPSSTDLAVISGEPFFKIIASSTSF